MKTRKTFNPDIYLSEAYKSGLQMHHFIKAAVHNNVPEKALHNIAERFRISSFELKQLIADYKKGGCNNE